jgi:hypothetical protein
VLLLGDATYDGKEYLGTGVLNRVPALTVKSSDLWTASDPGYGAVNGEDLLPDVAVGRLPAANVEQAAAMVEKVLAYEGAGMDLAGPAVLVADNPDLAGDFEWDSDQVASRLGSRNVEKIYLGALGRAGTRSAIVDALDRGASLLSAVRNWTRTRSCHEARRHPPPRDHACEVDPSSFCAHRAGPERFVARARDCDPPITSTTRPDSSCRREARPLQGDPQSLRRVLRAGAVDRRRLPGRRRPARNGLIPATGSGMSLPGTIAE